MAERGLSERLVGSKSSFLGLVRDHRVNDLSYGHVGRLLYNSAGNTDDSNNEINRNDNDDSQELDDGENESSLVIGQLSTNRTAESVHNFQEIARFQAWYPPARHSASSIQTKTPLHLNRLLAEAPELLAGVAGPLYPGFIEVAKESEKLKMPQTRLPLLSYGEITEMSNRGPNGRLALAMVTGVSGHALRIIQLRREHWGWHPEGNLTLHLSNIDAENEGHWCENNLSINQIKFTTSGSGDEMGQVRQPARWILVQTAAETIVFEPTVHGVSVPHNRNCACEYAGRGRSYLTANPIFRIPIKETGGRPHCDVAFNPAVDAKPSQLAIIDDAGQWSVWNIIGSTQARRNVLLPFLHGRGTFTDGIIAGPSMPAPYDLGHLHRVAWLPNTVPLHGESTQSSTLLLGSATAISITNLEQPCMPLRVLNLTSNVGLENVVDVQVSPNNASHVFVLTSTTLFWLDFSSLHAIPPPRQQAKVRKPLLLLSCPHLKSPIDTTMKLSLTSSVSDKGETVTLALIYSMRHSEITMFWFPELKADCEPTFQQQNLQLARPGYETPDAESEWQMGQQAMLLLPKDVIIKQSGVRSESSFGHQYTQPGVSVFQMITLGSDLSLWSSLCASSSGRNSGRLAPFPPVLKRKHFQKRQTKVEKKMRAEVKDFERSFVVADDLDDHNHLHRPKAGLTDLPQQFTVTKKGFQRTCEVYNMAGTYNLLKRRLDKEGELAYEASAVVRSSENPSPLDIIQQVLDIAVEHGSFAYTTLLNISNHEYLKDYSANLTNLDWTRQLANVDIGEIEVARVSISCAIKLDEARGDAVQLYFSQISVAVMPRQTLGAVRGEAVTAAQHMFGNEDGGLSAASMPYSGQRLHSAMGSRSYTPLLSSPVPSQQLPSRSGTPNWLPSSPQEDGLNGNSILPSLEDGNDIDGLPESEIGEDPTVARLRQYAKSIKSEPLRNDGELRLLSHWPLGGDPAQFHWVPMGAAGEAEEELRRQAQDARDRKRKKMERRAARDRERLLLLSGAAGSGTGAAGFAHLSSPAALRIQPSSQLLSSQMPLGSSQQTANYFYAHQDDGVLSQPALASPRPMASQVFSSQVLMSSQPVIRTGYAPGSQRPKKKKAKVARGFK
ncbi:hypothetical protein SEPCBS119000_004754 [Sporothrix epigloea]|uniref:Uncharacterized protein n=1 Tax=Sporothrix epigloea TaxID=1892477 RepID=A0ABP0DTX2_9PEZI